MKNYIQLADALINKRIVIENNSFDNLTNRHAELLLEYMGLVKASGFITPAQTMEEIRKLGQLRARIEQVTTELIDVESQVFGYCNSQENPPKSKT